MNGIFLKQGAHETLENGACVMELSSWVAGEKHSDRPVCVSPAIAAFLRRLNDRLDDEKRQQMGRAMMVKAKQDLIGRGEKATDQMVEAHALTDPQYAAFLDQCLRDKIEFITQQTQLDEIEERIRNREIALLAYNAEIKLAR